MSELKKSLRCALLFTLFSIALTGCTATPPQVAYYSLLGAESVKTTGQGHDQLVLSVGPVQYPRCPQEIANCHRRDRGTLPAQ